MATDKKMMLIEASIELFYKQGFWKSSTAGIAKHAKVATGTLFNYFSSKEQLIDAVYLHIKGQLLDELSSSYDVVEDKSDVVQVLENQWRSYIFWGMKYPIKHDLLLQLKLSDLVSDQAQETGMQSFGELLQILQNILQSGQLKDMDIEYFAEIFQAQLQAAIVIAKSRALTGEALDKHLVFSFSLFWDGIKKQSTPLLEK